MVMGIIWHINHGFMFLGPLDLTQPHKINLLVTCTSYNYYSCHHYPMWNAQHTFSRSKKFKVWPEQSNNRWFNKSRIGSDIILEFRLGLTWSY